MPEAAKVLAFRPRAVAVSCTREEAKARARAFLGVAPSERTEESITAALSDGDVLTAIFTFLSESMNQSPASVAQEAPFIYSWLVARPEKDFYFDERDFFMGESALLAAGSLRLLGKREETERWLDRADAGFRHTVAPAAHLARVSYIRLTLRYDQRRHEEVLELAPSVALTFQKLGMKMDLAKCRFLEAMSLKESGQVADAAERLESLAATAGERDEGVIAAMALVNLGNLRSEQEDFRSALTAYSRALPLLQKASRFSALADLKLMLGGTLLRTGQVGAAIEAFRGCVKEHAALGMETRTAYVRVVLAEALLEAGRPREAEWEILAALPTIDEQGMVPEGFVALGLLRESVRQRKTDPKALLELREYLQAKS